MRIERFEDILAWQKAKELVSNVYSVFRNNKDFSFKDQIQRAATSIMNNITEGFERKGNKEFKQFLFIAKGSCGEVRSMLCLSHELGYIRDDDFDKMFKKSMEISRIIAGFIRTL